MIRQKQRSRTLYKCDRCDSKFATSFHKCSVCGAYGTIVSYHIEGHKVNKIKKINDDWGFTNQRNMFLHIWDMRPHRSEISGIKLLNMDSKLWYSQFSHVLPKGIYHRFKFNPNNIILLTVTEHEIIDKGTRLDRERHIEHWLNKGVIVDYAIFEDKKQKLLKQYNEQFK